MPSKFFVIPVLCLVFCGAVQAQAVYAGAIDEPSVTTEASASVKQHQAFFNDSEQKLLFIDFESLTVNLKEVVLKDQNGAVLLRDQVFDLPVNTIYEIELGKFKPGTYSVELHSFTDVIRKVIRVE